MKKALVVATVAGFVASFEVNDIKLLQSLGYEVHCAASFGVYNDESKIKKLVDTGIVVHNIPFSRSPLSKNNLSAYKELKSLVETEHFDIVHTHTPNASMCVRLACRNPRKAGLKVIYTAHGFHFYKGAPLKNWLVYYPVEKICSRWTDVLITINKEDYAFAQRKMKAQKVVYVPGVGIDLNKFDDSKTDKEKKKKELGIPEDSIVLLSVGELNQNKNHELVIKAMSGLNKEVHYVVAGQGDKKDYLNQLACECGVEERVHLLGYRSDVKNLYSMADVFVFPSFREGLSVSLMEAMASGLPCAVSRIRGNVDLIDEKGGALFDPHSLDECVQAIRCLLVESNFGTYNKEKIKKFSTSEVLSRMEDLYSRIEKKKECE